MYVSKWDSVLGIPPASGVAPPAAHYSDTVSTGCRPILKLSRLVVLMRTQHDACCPRLKLQEALSSAGLAAGCQHGLLAGAARRCEALCTQGRAGRYLVGPG